MKIVNRLFATAFVALLLIASHTRAEHDEGRQALAFCTSDEVSGC